MSRSSLCYAVLVRIKKDVLVSTGIALCIFVMFMLVLMSSLIQP